jgi:hypothetical protein
MSAAKRIVPPELVELLMLLSELNDFLPVPAAMDNAGWKRRNELQDMRENTVLMITHHLAITLNSWNDNPHYKDMFAERCQEWAGRARERLAEPLGYEPKNDLSTGSLPSVYSSPDLSRG